MAITQTSLTSGFDLTDSQSYTTASITPGANALILLAVVTSATTPPADVASATGNGLTWVAIANEVYGPSSQARKITLLRAMGAAPSSGAISISVAGSGNTKAVWAVSQFDGVDTTGTNGSGAIVQSAVNNTDGGGTPFTLTVTLGALGDAVNNAVYMCSGVDNNGSAVTPGSGYTEISKQTGIGEDAGIETEWKLPGTTTPNAAWTIDFADIGGIAVEIKAGTGASSNQLMWIKA